jgi:ADP-ribose pyrophosphatase YjhB (NUDIX family)
MGRRTVYKVRAVVTDADGNVYAIKAHADHVCQLPGGTRKRSEKPHKAIKREIREELGFKIKVAAIIATIEIKRNGTREITTCFHAVVVGGTGRPKLTGRERARGLHACQYESPQALHTALSRTVRAYGRSAARRDLRLMTTALQAI